MAIGFVGTIQQSKGAILNRALNFTRHLAHPSAVTISTADIPDVTGITITNDAPNLATFINDEEETVAIRKGVLFTLNTTAATIGTTYTLTVTITTSASETDVYTFDVEVI